MQQVLFGKADDPLDAFMQILPDVDRLLPEEATCDTACVDEKGLLSLMSRHEAKVMPTNDNLNSILREIAHKEVLKNAEVCCELFQ